MSQTTSILKITGICGLCAFTLSLGTGVTRAETLTAGVALDIMPPKELSAYVQGIVEGLAQARYEKGGKDTDGMRCIYEWYYAEGGESSRTVIAAFDKYPSYSPGAVLSGLIRKECPE